MLHSQAPFDWHALAAETGGADRSAPSAHRLLGLLAVVVLSALVVIGRAVQLEWTDGARFRALASQPIERPCPVAAPRGRIVARQGVVLAADVQTRALALHYRWLEDPPDPAWVHRQALAALPRSQRRNAARARMAETEWLERRRVLHSRLKAICGLSDDEWRAKLGVVQTRVARLAEQVNERRLARFAAETEVAADSPLEATWAESIAAAVTEIFGSEAPRPPAPVVVAEQQAYHPIVDDLPADVLAEVAAHADDYPGVRIVDQSRREYPCGRLAAHVIGHLGADDRQTASDSRHNDKPVGRMGIERQYEASLAGRPGESVERFDHRGKLLSVDERTAPLPGGDVRLTLDVDLQRLAEDLLDHACRPHSDERDSTATPPPIGGAVVVMDVNSGELLVAAAAPRFAPQDFCDGDGQTLDALFAQPNDPLVDRVARMALPPGSVFKTLTALALVEMGICLPEDKFYCQGYLHQPDRQRCMIFRQQGIGHADLALAGALAQSCNVYFLHFAGPMGPEPLVLWARRLGFGRPTGIDLPDEAAGHLPQLSGDQPAAERMATAQALAIGQGTLTVTPLQVARLMAAVATDGRLVVPRLTFSDNQAIATATSPAATARISAATLQAVRAGLRQTVADPLGTAYASARLADVPLAGKTGTAQTSGADHAWFAGYAPADNPRYALVAVLEHGGRAGQAARIVRDLVARLAELDYLPASSRPGLAGD